VESSHPARPWLGLAVGIAGILLVVLVVAPFHDDISAAVPALLLVLPVVFAAAIGGRLVAVAVAVLGALALVSRFLDPTMSIRMSVAEDLVALTVFLAVALVVGNLVASVRAADRRRLAADAARLAALEQLDRDRAALLRSVSHDLRTPLATIRAVATDLQAGTVYDDATRHELLGLVGGEAERLDRIVANILSLSRIESGTYMPDLEPTDLRDLVEMSTRRLHRLLEHLSVELDLPADLPLVAADPIQIDQVLTNLLENAARHSRSGAPVTVAAQPVGRLVEVSVTDQGQGLHPDLQPFTPRPSTGAGASLGIGLVICRAIVESHGGTITAGGGSNGGARFAFTLRQA
jgi:K+-sensing histidine kinase KdpD